MVKKGVNVLSVANGVKDVALKVNSTCTSMWRKVEGRWFLLQSGLWLVKKMNVILSALHHCGFKYILGMVKVLVMTMVMVKVLMTLKEL